jgi:aerobic carbon-monoxide dehydrogenase medium subunit
VKPGRFAYHAPRTRGEALQLKRDHDVDGAFLAGGQSLMPMLNMRLAQPEVLIDLNGVADLDFIDDGDGAVTVGAMTRHAVAERDRVLGEACPLVAEALHHVGHRVIRNRGTIGGSVAHADAAAELPAAFAALRATINVESAEGTRAVAAEEFFQFHFTTLLEPDEMVASISVPRVAPDTGHAFLEVSRRHGDFAVAAVAALVSGDSARLVFSGVSSRPVIVDTDDPDPAADAVRAADAAGITDDLTATAAYRRRLVAVLARRARRAARRSLGSEAT